MRSFQVIIIKIYKRFSLCLVTIEWHTGANLLVWLEYG